MDTPRGTSPAVRHSRRSTGYVMLGFLASFMPMPYNAVAIVPLVAAVVESALTLRAMNAEKAPASMRRWTGFSLAITVLLLATVAVPYLSWSTSRSYHQCLDRANTAVAQSECTQSLSPPHGGPNIS